MSDDLIKRSDAIEAIDVVDWYHQNRNKDMVSGANSDEHQAWYKADDIYKALESVPTADRPQGEWHFDEKGNFFCSECKSYPRSQYATTDFCPNCGAKMKSPWVLKGADDYEREGE